MYLGRQPMSHDPYLWRSCALGWYLSAGLIAGALRVPIWPRGAVLIFFASFGSAIFCDMVVAKPRTIPSCRVWTAGFAGRRARASSLLLQSLVAMVVG